jgi:hypothetical protein
MVSYAWQRKRRFHDFRQVRRWHDCRKRIQANAGWLLVGTTAVVVVAFDIVTLMVKRRDDGFKWIA